MCGIFFNWSSKVHTWTVGHPYGEGGLCFQNNKQPDVTDKAGCTPLNTQGNSSSLAVKLCYY